MENKYRRYVWLLILGISLIKLVAASSVQLGNDEVYYWTYALYPDWSHFDHPPMIGWLIQLFSLNLLFDSELFMRLGSIVMCGASTWVLFRLVGMHAGERAGLFAAALFNASVYTGLIAGWMVMPDAPQLFFWLMSLYFLLKTVTKSPGETNRFNLLYFGLFVGLSMLSKYHSAVLWVGTVLYILIYNREWLRQKELYLGVLITIVVFSPVIFWNVSNDFVSFAFHGERVGFFDGGFRPDFLAIEFFGEILYQNPLVYGIVVWALVRFFRNKDQKEGEQVKLLLCISLPLIVMFWFVAMFHRTLPHWTGPAFVNLFIIASYQLSQTSLTVPKKSVQSAVALMVLILLIGPSLINKYPGTLSPFTERQKLGKGDVTLDMFGWDQLEAKVLPLLEDDLPIVASKWFPAAHLDYYLAFPNNIKLITIGKIRDTHKYEEITKKRGPLKKGENAYFIAVSSYYRNPYELYEGVFENIELISEIEITREKATVKNVFVFKLLNYSPESSNQ